MKRLCCLGLLCLCGCQKATPAEDLFTIRGTLIGAVKGPADSTISGVSVSCTVSSPANMAGTATRPADSTGQFHFDFGESNMPDTVVAFSLHVTASGYAPLDTTSSVRISRYVSSADTTHVMLSLHR